MIGERRWANLMQDEALQCCARHFKRSPLSAWAQTSNQSHSDWQSLSFGGCAEPLIWAQDIMIRRCQKAAYMLSVMSFQQPKKNKRSKYSFVYVSSWISAFWFASTAKQKHWMCRGQIYPFNMRGLTKFYVTDPLVTHWRSSSSVAGIKWYGAWAWQHWIAVKSQISWVSVAVELGLSEWEDKCMKKKSLTICCCGRPSGKPLNGDHTPVLKKKSKIKTQGFRKSSRDWEDFIWIR